MKHLLFIFLPLAAFSQESQPLLGKTDTITVSQCKCEHWSKHYDKCLLVLTAFAYFSAPDTIIPISFKGMGDDKVQMFLDDAKFENGVINSPSGTVTSSTWLKNYGLSTKLIYFLRKKKPKA